MASEQKPLSMLVSQGWEVVSFGNGADGTLGQAYMVLLRRQKQHKILALRPAYFGKGYVTKELDV